MTTPLAEVSGLDVQLIGGNYRLDTAVIKVLPAGTEILSADRWGKSSWNTTVRINTLDPNKCEKQFFLKCATPGEQGQTMMQGEFSAMTELYKFVSTFIPEPYTWGKFESGPLNTYFFLLEFKDMTSRLPDPKPFCFELAKLHQTSISPTGKFGFHIATTHGKLPQYMVWTSSWEAMFKKILSDLLLLDLNTNSPWENFQDVYERTLTLVLPKLIGPLESEGQTIKPCLLHGDLWDGNIGIDNKTGQIYIFDASSFYGHNELELGMWRSPHLNRMSWDVYGKEYLRTVGASEPAHQFDDRNRIYHVKFLMWHSAHHPNDAARESAYENLRYLVDKYAPWPTDVPGKGLC